MASREKRPLAPSKSKQKANNDSGLLSNEIKSKKGKSLPTLRQQQLARDILEAVATGSQLPAKLEASLPRKKVLKNLKRKQKLRVAKANLIKSKVTKKVPNKNLRRISSDIKKKVRTKRIKLSEERNLKTTDARLSESYINDTEVDNRAIDTSSRSAKNNLRTKKTKSKSIGELESEEDKDIDIIIKSSPKFHRKSRGIDTADSSKSAKQQKYTGLKRNNIKIAEGEIKYKGRKSRDPDYSLKNCGIDTKYSKSVLDTKSSIDLTIDEVIASMLSDSEVDSQQGSTEKVEGKVTRSKKMLVDDNLIAAIDIKKEVDTDESRIVSDGEYAETEQGTPYQNAIQLRKRLNASMGQRSLRNGKLRQLSDSGVTTELDVKKRRRLNSDEPVNSEVSAEQVSDNVDTESYFSESSGNETQAITPKEEPCPIKEEISKGYDEGNEAVGELENNNNSDRVDRTGEVGPTLRSKTKARSTENDVKTEDVKVEDTRTSSKEAHEETKKANNLEQVRKDNILAKFTDKVKGRRSSLNIDMKKTVNSFYATEKTEGNPKSQIDQMIENIKLTIAKSIESKIFGPEKGLGLNKNFEVPKIEEIIAPLSAESQKLGLEENAEEDNKSNVSKNEIKSENSENSVPKVADTAKEIEKLVMGDIELAETQSQNTQESESSDSDEVARAQGACESTQQAEDNEDETDQQGTESQSCSNDAEKRWEGTDNQSKALEDSKKTIVTRKSSRSNDKGSPESPANTEPTKKLNRTPNKTVQKSDTSEDTLLEEVDKSTSPDEDSSNRESPKSDPSKNLETAETSLTSAKDDKSTKAQIQAHCSESETLNVSVASEESETLESISREVERLVAEDHTAIQPPTSIVEHEKSSVSQSEESQTKTITPDSQSTKSEPSDTAPEAKEVTLTATEVEKSKSIEASESHIVKKPKNNSQASPVANCDLNCEHGSTKSRESNVSDENSKDDSESDREEKSKDTVKCNSVSNDSKDELNSIRKPEQNESAGEENDKSSDKIPDDQKSGVDDNRRVLRTRDKQKKLERRQTSRSRERLDSSIKIKVENDFQRSENETEEFQSMEEKTENSEETDDIQNGTEFETTDLSEPLARTRRSREVKRRKEEQQQMQVTLKTKRARRDLRKSDQQNKEETLLDNEVAKINENNRSFLANKFSNAAERTENFRGFSEGGQGKLEKDSGKSVRSKSENDLTIVNEAEKSGSEGRLSRNLLENDVAKEADNIDMLDSECKAVKTPETSQKDSDEASTSGESSSSMNLTPKILETPEDKAKKESILRLLGLESLEKAAERLNHQKARKEQYTGTLKTVIRVQKEKDKDKRRSRSPLKMVLKQGRGDGEGDSPEFYTIQKEFGTSGLGDSSSGANRKFTTNHRHSCDEDNEETPPKDRQSLVIPEKSSSFSIHPGRLCADVCCYCFGKFGSLDTPMHLAQMKSDERRKKILNIERHLTKDSCLCDACYRHVDRKANTSPTNLQAKPPKQHRQLMVSKCSARDCRDPARHHVKRRWLLKIKAGLQNQVDIDWESSQHTSMSFCVTHYSKIERFLTCALCKRRLARNHTHQLANAETDELNMLLGSQNIPVILAAGTFVCKLCRYFTQLQLKYKDVENMNTNHRSFFKSYRKRILHYHDIEVLDNEDDDPSQNQSKDKDKRKKAKCAQAKTVSSKSPDAMANSASEKSTPEPTKNEGMNSETDNENRIAKVTANDEAIATDVQFLGIESTVEKLKKRKMLDMHTYTADNASCDGSSEVVEILAMDKEVTLTRLPKRARTNNDISPVVQRLGANPSISVRTLFPGEEEMNLHANIEFTNVREITPQGWEKCATMIQYDRDTKLLWQELQRPYGNQSSFLRHLILLEKYYRSGDLVLAPNASRNAINYSTSVQNRLISYEGPEKMDEPIMEPIPSEYTNPRRLSGGYVLERDRLSLPSTSTSKPGTKGSPPRVLKLNSGVSIIKKPPPNLQRLSLPSTSNANGNVGKRKDGPKIQIPSGKVFQLSEPDFKRLQTLKKQKQLLNEKQAVSPSSGSSNSPPSFKAAGNTQYQKAQLAAQTQFQKHLRMQQEMLNRQSRGDFEPLICDVRSLANENSPTQNLLHNLNLPKSIQVTTKPPNPIPILPKIPKSLTVIPQTVTRPTDK